MAFDPHTNLLSGTIQTPPTPATFGQVFVLQSGQGSRFAPNQPVTICPAEVQPEYINSEIGYVTTVSGDTLTVLRAQEDSLSQPVQAGWRIFGSLTAKTLTDIEESVTSTQDDLIFHTMRTDNPHSVTKVQIGLDNVDNTSDANKPINTAMQTALNAKTDFPTANNRVPIRGSSGNQASLPYSTGSSVGSIPIRKGGGEVEVGTPAVALDATNKAYVDSLVPLKGTGFPNGVVTAPVGSIYIDTDVTNGASSWIKKSGTGNTGWQVLEGDTGWSNITSLVNPLSFSGGAVYIRRQNNTVEIEVIGLVPTSGNSLLIQHISAALPGFSPRGIYSQQLTGFGSPAALGWLIVGRGSSEGLKIAAGTGTRWGLIQYPYSPDAQLWPTTLPGTPA